MQAGARPPRGPVIPPANPRAMKTRRGIALIAAVLLIVLVVGDGIFVAQLARGHGAPSDQLTPASFLRIYVSFGFIVIAALLSTANAIWLFGVGRPSRVLSILLIGLLVGALGIVLLNMNAAGHP